MSTVQVRKTSNFSNAVTSVHLKTCYYTVYITLQVQLGPYRDRSYAWHPWKKKRLNLTQWPRCRSWPDRRWRICQGLKNLVGFRCSSILFATWCPPHFSGVPSACTKRSYQWHDSRFHDFSLPGLDCLWFVEFLCQHKSNRFHRKGYFFTIFLEPSLTVDDWIPIFAS